MKITMDHVRAAHRVAHHAAKRTLLVLAERHPIATTLLAVVGVGTIIHVTSGSHATPSTNPSGKVETAMGGAA